MTLSPFVRRVPLYVLIAVGLLTTSCGGGGGGSAEEAADDPPVAGLPPSSTLAQQCAPANALAPAGNRTASLDTERRWVRSYLDEAYLWYREVPLVDTAQAAYNVASVPQALDNYFNALLTPALTTSGRRRDQFSFTYPTAEWNALSQSGVSAGFGAEWLLGSPTPPRNIRVAFVDPSTPAAAAGVGRGMTLVSVDGVSADDNTSTGIDQLIQALVAPVAGRSYTFVLRDRAQVDRVVAMTAGQVTRTPVPTTRVIDTASGRVGYITFHDHMRPAEGQLVTAFQSLAQAGVSDLVLDLRYNGGGYLYIASQVGYMVAGAARTAGRTFERLQFNDKRTADNNDPDNTAPFYNATSGFEGSGTSGNQSLPQLGMGRVFVLAGPGTCSASESIVNGLRGVGVDVVLIGGTTCGKPYGFTARDNCGISYFPIEFSGTNAAGFGDYADGFAATCSASDDLGRDLGDPAENLLATALSRRATGVCPPVSARESAQSLAVPPPKVIRSPAREVKLR